jgi:hypothetical protein
LTATLTDTAFDWRKRGKWTTAGVRGTLAPVPSAGGCVLERQSSFASVIDSFLIAKRFQGTSLADYRRYLREFDKFTRQATLAEALTLDNAIKWTRA